MFPQAIALTTLIVPGLLQLFTSIMIPVAGNLLQFTLPRLVRIPLYLRLLWTIYQDPELKNNAEARKYLTSVLLILGSILTFMAYSYVPLTGVPIIGALTTPVAAMIAIVVSLTSLDFILALNRDYLTSKYPEEFATVRLDIDELAKTMGKSWDGMLKQTQTLLDSVKKQLDPNEDYDSTLLALINALISYLWVPQDNKSLSPEEINHRIVTNGLPPLAKVGGSVAEGLTGGAIAGAAGHAAAANIFVQAGFLTSIKAAIGIGGGIVVGAPVYAALTMAAPIGLAVIAGVGVGHGAMMLRNEGEKRKLSAFLADILIAALPIAWVDGDFSSQERDTLEQFLLNPSIHQEDAQRVRNAMEQHITFDDVLHMGLLKEDKPEKAQMKHRLLLCMAWEIARADLAVSAEEMNLHNRMAKLMKMEEEEVGEIRRLILLKSGIDLRQRVAVVQGDITQQSVDVIVNSTNPTLLPGNKLGWFPLPGDSKKVDTAIHRTAGAALQKECQSLKGCAVGETQITQGYNLPAQWVIHTVSPTFTEGKGQEQEFLGQCYRNSLRLAHQRALRTIAFPALGTGTGKFPVERAARIALTEVQQFLNTHFTVEQVKLVCWDESTYQTYVQAAEEILGSLALGNWGQRLTGSAEAELPIS